MTFIRLLAGVCLSGMTAGAVVACNAPMVLTQQEEARRIASELQVQFMTVTDAANRAVMSDSDAEATSAAREAETAGQTVLGDAERLQATLQSMGYSEELRFLSLFSMRFAEYQKLDAEILQLAVENTNLKAQRLSFGPSRDALNDLRTALQAAVKMARPSDAARVNGLAARVLASVLEIQVLQAPHIAESDDAAMTRMEAQMSASEQSARKGLEQLGALLPPESRPQVTEAMKALDRFRTINAELIALSRRNSDVRSLAMTLGQKRAAIAQCLDQLRGLREALTTHENKATR